MNRRTCHQCLIGRLVEVGDVSVCPRCRAVMRPPAPAARPGPLTVLTFYEQHPRADGSLIRRELGIGPTAYAQLLNRALDDPEAAAKLPGLVARLRAERDRIARLRTGAA